MKNMSLEAMHQHICAAMNQYVAAPYSASDVEQKRRAVLVQDLGNGACIMDATDFVRQYPQYYDAVFKGESASDGHAVVFVPAGVLLTTPIELPGDGDVHSVTLILGAQAHATVHASVGATSGSGRRTITCLVGQRAQLYFMHEQMNDLVATYFSTIIVHADAHAMVEMHLLIMGAAFSNTLISTHMRGAGAQVTVRGAYLLTGSQQAQIATLQNHAIAGGSSTVDIRGILAGGAHAVYHGTIFIDGQAASSQAAQVNKNILLGAQCRAHSLPILQVLNNDVHCAHGSAVGQVDELAIFYMQARGIDVRQARTLLLEGFVANVLPERFCQKVKQALSLMN